MARRTSVAATLFVAVLAAVAMLQGTNAATNYTVGDATGWTIPANTDFYDDWDDNKDLVVGDVLVFNFATGAHDVAEVSEADYENCNINANTVFTERTGPASITLNRTGDHYFICTFGNHCSRGQKLKVEVDAATPRVSPAPRPSPPTPTNVATNYTVGDATGWTIPSNTDFYDDWDDNKNFFVGDVLVFNFVTGAHDVAEVSETDYENCNTNANTIFTEKTGPASITLNRTGDHYFICTIGNHCSRGQKLKVEVNAAAPRASPAPRSSPTTPTNVATNYTVGDATGWTIPTNTDFYDNWEDNKNFTVGDVLVFNFVTGAHDVAEVSEDDYENCNTNAKTIFTERTGPASITLNRTGDHYFICTFGNHCSRGQKLKVEVAAATPRASPATPRASPTAPRSSPASTSSPTAPRASPGPGSSPTTPSGTTTSTPNSASSTVATFSLVFVSIALVFFC